MTTDLYIRKIHVAAALVPALIVTSFMAGCQRSNELRVEITVPPALRDTPIDGRILLLLSKGGTGEPRLEMREPRNQISTDRNAPHRFQFFGIDVEDLAPGTAATVDANAVGFPFDSFEKLPPGDYTMQAVLNVYETFTRKDGHRIKAAMDYGEGQKWNIKPGNLYSEPRTIRIDPATGGRIAISLDRKIPPRPQPAETEHLKHVRIESKLLSEFWGRRMELGAWVLLPDGFDEHPDARYPIVVDPAEFNEEFRGGAASFSSDPPTAGVEGAERIAAEYNHKLYEDWTSGKMPRMLVVNIQQPNPYYGESFGVNSANMGPYGDAITSELIPHIERTFRGIGEPWARTLIGCSVGGWAALSLQIFYPDLFNGAWVGAPGPIDLRAYGLVNVYQDKNAYWYEGPFGRVPRSAVENTGTGEVHPRERVEDDHVGLTMEADNRAELVAGTRGRGAGVWDAMQAAFSPVGPDGYPKPIWDKRTGLIDAEVTKHWKDHYDLGYILRRDWTSLGPKLVGKIHLTAGTHDQYFFANATRYVGALLESTTDPHYGGTFELGERFTHCYQGDPTQPVAISSRTVLQRQLPIMAARLVKTAPSGADVKSWRY